jgi:hypothetical protein
MKKVFTHPAVLLGLYTTLVLGGIFLTATILGAPVGVPAVVVGVKRGWRAIKAL